MSVTVTLQCNYHSPAGRGCRSKLSIADQFSVEDVRILAVTEGWDRTPGGEDRCPKHAKRLVARAA